MSIYTCRRGHIQRSQEKAINCGYCKAIERKQRETKKKPLDINLKK